MSPVSRPNAWPVRGAWLGLLLLQPTWLWLLPAPLGPGSPLLAAVACVPLLLPLGGIWRGSLRSMTWGGYLAMLYLLVGVTEAWANPPQRVPALSQVVLVGVYVAAVLRFSRPAPPAR